MPSKQVIDLHRVAASVTAGALHNRERITAALTAQLEEDGVFEALSGNRPPEPPAEVLRALSPQAGSAVIASRTAQLEAAPAEVPNLDELQRFAAWAIQFYAEKMMQVDDLHLQERQQDWVVRARRDEAAEEAYREYVRVRQMMTTALAPETVSSILGLEGDTPRAAFVLRDKLRFAIQRMESPGTFFPEVRIAGLAQDWPELIRRLRDALAPLDQALQALELEAKAADTAFLDKEQAIRRYRAAYSGWANILRGLYNIAEEPELARRLSPTVARRSGGTEPPEPDGPPPDGEEGLPEPPSEEVSADSDEVDVSPGSDVRDRPDGPDADDLPAA